MRRQSKAIPLSKALLQIFLSTLLISGSATLLWLYYDHVRLMGSRDPRYSITTIIQTGPEKEQLSSDYLVEVLGLSSDVPSNLYSYDYKEGERRLLQTPFIAAARVKPVKPSTLYVDYTVRKPIGRLGRRPDLAVDAKGATFPIEPFYSTLSLPNLYFNKEDLEEVVDLLRRFPNASAIDVSRLGEENYGRREVIVTLPGERYLRLNSTQLDEEVENIELMKARGLLEEKQVVDLRLGNSAFLKSLN